MKHIKKYEGFIWRDGDLPDHDLEELVTPKEIYSEFEKFGMSCDQKDNGLNGIEYYEESVLCYATSLALDGEFNENIKEDMDKIKTGLLAEDIRFDIMNGVFLDDPKVGDYVIGSSGYFLDETNEFLKKNIGCIVSYKENDYNNTRYQVEYRNTLTTPPENEDIYVFVPNLDDGTYGEPINFVFLYNNEIEHFSKNKKDLDIYLNANKYNI